MVFSWIWLSILLSIICKWDLSRLYFCIVFVFLSAFVLYYSDCNLFEDTSSLSLGQQGALVALSWFVDSALSLNKYRCSTFTMYTCLMSSYSTKPHIQPVICCLSHRGDPELPRIVGVGANRVPRLSGAKRVEKWMTSYQNCNIQ